MIKEICIQDFPKNIFIELPENYRNMLFQLVFLGFETGQNARRYLIEKRLRENAYRWRRGHDKGFPQFINLESLLFLFEISRKIRNEIEGKTNTIKAQLKKYENRIKKSKELMSFIKDLRFILGGNYNISERFKINPGTFRHYVNDIRIKNLPSQLIAALIKFAENNILCFNFTIDELQNKIITYHAHHGKSIKPEFQGKRKLPIEVTPEFESIIYHLLGDGHVKEIGSGEYTQLSEIGRKNFLNKLYNVFGYFEIARKSFNDGRIIIPKAIVDILCKYYNLNYDSFNWGTSRLPVNVSSDIDFKIAGLTAFIIDEGHVNNRGIEIYSGNSILLSQIRNMAVDLGLNCSELKVKKANGNTKESYRFRIRKKSSTEFFKMVSKLKEKYQYCGLAQKENLLNI